MIDIETEQLLTLNEAARIINPDRPPHTSTLWRWKTRGVRGKVLESITIGGKPYTSREAIQRFATPHGGQLSSLNLRSPKHRERAIKLAEQELDRAGI